EEEIGSPHLADFIENNKRLLRSDVALLSDTAMPKPHLPAIAYGLRGVLYAELTVSHAVGDLHSGNYGGSMKSALQILCELICRLFRADGSIAIEGFYESVEKPKPFEAAYIRQNLARLTAMPYDPNLPLPPPGGEQAKSYYERTALRPSLTVAGIGGGYGEAGLKAVAPSEATAKLDFRLSPRQDPERIFRLLHDWVDRRLPPGYGFDLKKLMALPAVVENTRHPAIRAAKSALREVFGTPPLLLRSGGTVPVVHLIKKSLGIPVVMMGFGLPADHIHAPNERFYLPNFFKGIAASRRFLEYLSLHSIQTNNF
ncbi:MAG: M20/M25/M40 family metallo-hydrolase, partial [Bacteroidota bacterium]